MAGENEGVSQPRPGVSAPAGGTATNRAAPAGKDTLSSVSLPSITAPRGGGAIRSIGETFRANAATGTGSLAVPLPLSPARAGAGPKLTLSYDSGAGQGPFGIGWSVDLPSITRRTDKGLPQYRDADESDELVLSGAEVLVPALAPSGSSWQLDAFDDGPYHVQRYRPRVESAFARVERRTDRATGDVHWRTVSRDNTTSLFGKSPSARLADPRRPERVFRWLIEATFDDRGNATWFEYKPEDTTSVPPDHAEEKTRLADPLSFANRYVKRIHYGNRTPLASADPTGADLAALAWLFEVVFDYGEHDAAAPTPAEALAWGCRADPFSSFKATFDVRTYRLCGRVLMFHQIDELGPAPVLVRSLDLVYEPSPVTTYLLSVTETGWQATAAGYTRASMPRLDLDYTRADLQTTVQTLAPESVVHAPGGVDGSRYRFIDLDGEGLPGVLSQQGGALFYKRNYGGGRLGRAEALRTKPSVAAVGAPGQMLTSLDADGRMDLVLLGDATRGFFEREDEGWSPLRRFLRAPTFNPADPNLRFLDLDGDGLADVLVAEDEVFVWSRSLGKDGFDRPQVMRKASQEDAGPTFVFADAVQSIFVADMTGDGLVDLVRVRDGEICYWPNLGYCRFGAKITMGAAPCFDGREAFDPKRLRFGDVDGSGTSDIAYVRPDGVAIYLNQAGNRWSDPVVVAGIRSRRDSSIDLVDLLGTGTSCLVWSSPQLADGAHPIRYVDLLASTKPHLLASVRNNLGQETRVAYAPSTRFYVEDRAAGTPWVTRLPFPVQVLARIETADAVQGTRLVTTYRYKHGFYDGFEREFRGFGRVDQWDAEYYPSAHGEGLLPPGLNEQDGEVVLPPVHAVTWLDTGAWREARDLYAQYRREWYALDAAAPQLADPILPDGLSLLEEREAARARKGMLLRREVYAEDGTPVAIHPYLVEEHRYEVRRLQPMAEQRHPVIFTHERESVGRHYERDPADPRVEHTFNIEVDPYGNVLRSASVAYPRRVAAEPEQGILLATCADASFVNETAAFYRIGVPIETRSYELTGLATPAGLLALADVDAATMSATLIPFEATATPGVLQKRTFAHRRTLYRRDDLAGPLPLGTVESRVLVYQAYAKALTENQVASAFGARVTPAVLTTEGGYVSLDGDFWRPSAQITYDAARFYQATALTDAFGNTARVVHDAYAMLVLETHASDDATLDNVALATNDYRVLQPARVTDANGNQTAVAFDALGMVVATAVMGKGAGEGDTLADPTTRLEYDLLAWQNGQGPAYVHTYAREQHGAANPRWQEVYSYSDGSGQEVMRKVQAEPDAGGQPRWVGTGRTVFDNKGNPVKKYEPYFSPTPAYEDEPSIVMQGVTPILRYDALSRLVRTDLPDGTFETVERDAWGESDADANDNVLESAWYATNEALPASDPRRRAADLAAAHAHTPTRKSSDPLGRTFLTVADNGAAGTYATRTALDIQGNARTTTDARGNAILVQTFDLEQHVIDATSADGGRRLSLRDVAGNPVRAFDGRGFAIRTEYDRLRRPLRVFAAPPASAEILAERLVYGEAAGGGVADNLRGRKTLHYDGAGELHQSSYDFQGNLTVTTRRLTLAYQQTPDWAPLAALTDAAAIQALAATLLETESFTTTLAFDALDRPVRITTPDASAALPTYNEANLLSRLDVCLRGATMATPFVTALDYNARGQRVHADYANGASTTYTYDPLTFLLVAQTTLARGKRLQDFALVYDPAHNIVEVDDTADPSPYFSGTTPVAGGGLYTYDAIYRMVSASGREHPGQQMPDPGDAPLASLPHPNDTQALRAYTEQYDYDPAGNILRVLHKAGGAGWTRHYQYAPDSNRLQRTSMPGDLDAGPYSGVYAHDDAGNVTQMPHLATLAWDHANRMVSADLGGGGTSYFTYDATGMRVRKVTERIGTRVTERIYLGGYEVYRQRTGASLDEERQTLHVMDDRQQIAMVETKTVAGGAPVASPAPRFRYQLTNSIDSVCVEVDETGAPFSYEEYFPFGATSFRSGSGATDVSAKRYRYTGKERDDETGLSYHGARYYAAWLGRWSSPDPAGLGAGINLYAYVHDNPVRLSDPTGRNDDDSAPTCEPIGGSHIPGSGLDLPPVPHYTLDPANFWYSTMSQSLGIMTRGTEDIEAPFGLGASSASGLGQPSTAGGGLQNGQFAYRRQVGPATENAGGDVGITAGGSYLTQGSITGSVLNRGVYGLLTGHGGVKLAGDFGLAAYGSGGVAGQRAGNGSWVFTPTGALTGAIGWDRGNPEPNPCDPPQSPYHVSLNNAVLNPTGSYAQTGQLSQGPTLHNVLTGGVVGGIGLNIGRSFVLTAEASYLRSTGSGDGGQSASSDTYKGGLVGTYNYEQRTGSGRQTSSIAVGAWFSHEAGSVTGPTSATSPTGAFATDTFTVGIILGYRRPASSN